MHITETHREAGRVAPRLPHLRQRSTPTLPRPGGGTALSAALSLAVLLALIFGLPHLLIPRFLGSDHSYTPFAISGVSALTYDETSLYAAQAHYTYVRWKPAYDTDVFEHREVPSLVPTLPHFAIAALARVLGGVDRAFVVCDFLLPAVAFLLLFALILDMTASRWIAAAGGVVTLLLSFGPRNFVHSTLGILLTGATSQLQPLEFSRLLHPELSFTLLLGAWLFLWRTLRYGRAVDAAIAGFIGGLLFYTYPYYWVPWVATSALLLLAHCVLQRKYRTPLWILNGVTWLTGSFFWLTYLRARAFPNYEWVLERFSVELGHQPGLEKVLHTLAYGLIFGLFVLAFRRLVMPRAREAPGRRDAPILLFHVAVFLGAVGAMNMEIVTGQNVMPLAHFPNRLFQPYLAIAFFALVAPTGAWCLRGSSRRMRKAGRALGLGGLVIVLGFSSLRQIQVAVNTTHRHETKEEHRLLFSWLDRHTRIDDVLITTDVDINYLIPVHSHDRSFVANGTRSSASSEEIGRRFLLAMKLLGHSEDEVRRILSRDASQGDPPLGLTYTFYLFLGGYGQVERRLPEGVLEKMLREYRGMDLARELARFRADFVYVRTGETLRSVAGWRFSKVHSNDYGSVMRIARTT